MKFTIRDLLLVTVIVAILTAWWLDRSKLANELKKQKSPYPYPAYSKTTPVLDWGDGAWASQLPNSSVPTPIPPKP